MAGYLTHMMVLIKAELWLDELITGLEERQRIAGSCLTEVEEALLVLARNARALLRVDPAAPGTLPATSITNGVGNGLSKYALIGSIGMDFPINGYVFALNRDWVSRTMRLGAARRAYVRAGSTEFVLNFIKALNDMSMGLEPEQQRDMRSYALGHLAGIAADVVLQPAINSWAWSDQNTDHLDQHTFKVQLDARVARGFFQRDHLHQGQSWEDYFLSNCDIRRETEKLPKVFLKAFTDTYGGTRPTEAICATSTCRAPEITEDFLKDGYANTKGWAIGVGYDQSPWYWYKWLLGVFVLAGGVGSVFMIWSSTSTYNIQSWRDGNAFQSERFWHDLISTPNTLAGAVYMPFTLLAKFPIIWDGLFGQGMIGSTDRPAGKAFVAIFKGILDALSLVFTIIHTSAGLFDRTGAYFTAVDPVVQQPYLRWPRFGVGAFLELLKTFWIDMESVEQGEEGDRLGFTMFWPVKVMTFGVYFVSVLIVFGAKHERRKADGTRDDANNGVDYVLGMFCPVFYIAVLLGTGFFENYVLEKLAGARWPDTATGNVDRFLPLSENGTRTFTATGATGFPVKLFETDNQGVITTNGREHYAEAAAASPWDTVRQRDDEFRKDKSHSSGRTDYKMHELIDHAAHLAGLLAMAAVNYDAISPNLRDSVKEIFKDWNLDYRTVAEWDALMDPSTTAPGLLTAVARWTDDLRNSRAATDSAVLTRIEQEMAVTGFSGRILADFTHTRGRPRGVPSPLPSTARCGRLRRPGAIILPNLNIDSPITVPSPPSRLPDRRPNLDALRDNTVEESGDNFKLTEFRLERPTQSASAGYELVLKIHADDARRVRVFEMDFAAPNASWPRRFGADFGGAHSDRYAIAGAGPGQIDFCVEALTLPGDPLRLAPTGAAPLGRDGVTAVAPARVPGDIWMELVHRARGADLPNLTDIANFTIAPWLMFSNLQPTVTVYVVTYPDTASVGGNHPTVGDLVEGIKAALGTQRVVVNPAAPTGGVLNFTPNQPLPPGPLLPGQDFRADGIYLIDGMQYDDQWIQDEIEIGYCSAPHAWSYMTLHLPRKRKLEPFVHQHIPSVDMGLFDSFNRRWTSINYGGNLEVSPPVNERTPPIAEGQAGLAVPEHHPAPLGKIILGEGLIYLFDLGAGLATDFDLGGVPSAAIQSEFNSHFQRLSNTDITSRGSGWRLSIPGAGLRYAARRVGGRIQVTQTFRRRTSTFDLDLSFEADLVAGEAATTAGRSGHSLERLQAAFLERNRDLPVPRITVRSPGNEWLITITGAENNTDPENNKITRLHYLVRREAPGLKVYEARIADPEFKNFLKAQAVQPVLTFDTSWLTIGHVDEVAIFVPSDTPKGFKLLIANTELAKNILEQAFFISDTTHPITRMYRGKFWTRGRTRTAAIAVEDLLNDHARFNEALQTERLNHIETRLINGLHLEPTDVIHIPVLYHGRLSPGSIGSGATTSANTPNMVNLQVVDRHVMVPKPFGARMRIPDVITVLELVHSPVSDPTILDDLLGHWHWARRGASAANMASTFSVTSASIRSDAKNGGKFNSAGNVINNWDRIWIPEDNVDLLEAYVFTKLRQIGLMVHWIDDWDYYHIMDGEVHCGTNVIRKPPDAARDFDGPYWWNNYHP